MSASYYIRSQGRVVGPFSFEDLKKKADKGHLKKTHQVSKDQSTWQSARSVEGLFAAPPKIPQPDVTQSTAPVSREPDLVEVQLIEDEPLEVVISEEETEWHYCLQGDGQTQGPVLESKLKTLLRSGRLPSDTLVWNDTLSDWIEATRIPALGVGPSRGAAGPGIMIDGPILEPRHGPNAGNDLPVLPLASASLILGIVGIFLPIVIPNVLAIVFGHQALGQLKGNRQYQGDNLAKTGMILGYVMLIVILLAGGAWLIFKLAKG